MLVEWLRDEDIAEANDFHNRAYGTARTLAQWRWEFDRPIGSVRPFAVAKEEGRIVGTQALMPITLVTPKGSVLTAKSEETLVDASMRGRGVFQAMYAPLFDVARVNGVQAIWGFTPAFKPFEGIGFNIPARTSQLVYPFNANATDALGAAAAVAGWRRRALRVALTGAAVLSSACVAVSRRGVPGLELKVLERPPADAGDLCREFVTSWGGATILRDEAYLRWRFYDNPFTKATLVGAFRNGKLLGWLAYSLDASSIGYLVDAIVPREPSASGVLGALVSHCLGILKAAGAVAVRSWHVNQHPFDLELLRVAKSLGFYHVRRGEPVVLRLEEGLELFDELRSWNSWFVSRAFTQGESG